MTCAPPTDDTTPETSDIDQIAGKHLNLLFSSADLEEREDALGVVRAALLEYGADLERQRNALQAKLAEREAEIVRARRTAEYWKAEHLAGNVEIERLRKIEHLVWHLLDDSEENAQTGIISFDPGDDYRELCALLPEDHPAALDAKEETP